MRNRVVNIPTCCIKDCERKPLPPNKACWMHHAEGWEIHKEYKEHWTEVYKNLFQEEFK